MVRGSCLCGDVGFEITGTLTPIQLCHARRCRKASGAAFAPEMLAERDGFRFVRGEAGVRIYEAPLLDEPPPYRRAFCDRCGSPLPVELEGTPFVILVAGVLDDDPGTRPFRHAFLREAAAWYELSDTLPRHAGQPPPPGAETD